MKRIIVLLSLFLFLFVISFGQTKEKIRKPNIIFILADDMIYDAIGAFGRADMKTPTLDKLANEGVRFTRYYNTTAICMASRATLMTGKYEFSTGCNFSHGAMANKIWRKSYPVLLKEDGYITGFEGKFGFKVENPDGSKGDVETVKSAFDWWCGWLGQGKYQMEQNSEAEEYFRLYGHKPEHTTFALGTMGTEFIKKYAHADKPFCLSISFKAPHKPYTDDQRYDSVYKDTKFIKPGNWGRGDLLPDQAKAGRPYRLGKNWLNNYDETMRKYHQLVFGMDQAINRILEELKIQGLEKNTIIIFTSDNGHFNGARSLGGKLYAYEEGSLAPMIIINPLLQKKMKHQSIDALVAGIDVAPTILDIAGVQKPSGMQGESMLPIIEGKSKTIHESVLLMNLWGVRAAQSVSVVTRDSKYINWFYGADNFQPKEELYDMKKDRLELHNLADDPAHQDELENMYKLYDRWMDFWKNHSVDYNGYAKYSILARRGVDFKELPVDMIHDMGPINEKTGKQQKKENNRRGAKTDKKKQ